MPLTVGEKAPPFVLPASTGQHISLHALAGKTVVLYFYPRDDTPGCTTEACGFRDSYETLKAAGVEVLGVRADSLRAHTKFTEKYHLPFPCFPILTKQWPSPMAPGAKNWCAGARSSA